jgi:hypothetical protein
MMHSPVRLTRALADVQRSYIWSVNSAIEAGNTELATELADSYQRESNDLARDIAAADSPRAAAA